MSTVVALGHFCEVHGPRLVFYTIRNINEPQFVSQCPDLKFCSGCKAPLLEGYISTVQTVQSTAPDPPSPSRAVSRDGDRHSQHHHHHTHRVDDDDDNDEDDSPIVTNSHSAPGGFSSSKGLRPSSSSQHLTSIANTTASGGYVSRGTSTNNCSVIDCDTNTNTISTRDRERSGGGVGTSSSTGHRDHHRDREGAPPSSTSRTATTATEPSAGTKYYCSHSNYDHSHLSHLQTCISRTLSCELSPSNSVAFTSSDIWVIGTAFSLKDSQARGFHRRYCLIFTFLPEVPQCCRDPDAALDQDTEYGGSGGTSKRGGGSGAPGSGRGGSTKGHHHQQSKASKKVHKGGGRTVPPIPANQLTHHQHRQGQGCSTRDDFYSDGDCKGYTGYYGGGYPSLVPYYDYITEEFYNIAKNLQSECDKVYFKEQSISPQRALRLSTFLDGSIPGSSLSAGASSSLGGHGRSKIFTRSHSTGARSLPLLTANPHVFLDLHEKFAKILHHVDL